MHRPAAEWPEGVRRPARNGSYWITAPMVSPPSRVNIALSMSVAILVLDEPHAPVAEGRIEPAGTRTIRPAAGLLASYS